MNRDDLLLTVLRDTARLATLDLADWDLLVRQARGARLLGRIAALVSEHGLEEAVPSPVRNHLEAARAIADKHATMMRWEVRQVGRVLAPIGATIVLLKGAAYVMAGLPPARGRLFSDMDILVPKADLARVEGTLMANGWEPLKLHPYDQRYYRTWMQELPPLEHRVRHTTLDVHHTILPETGRLRPDPAKLLAAARPVGSLAPETSEVFKTPAVSDVSSLGPTIKVLAPADMVLNSAAHLFQDGEVAGGLRDLIDIDDLLRHFAAEPGFWDGLVPRARELDLDRPLYYALRYARELLDTPVPEEVERASSASRPPWPLRPWMHALVRRGLRPEHPDGGGPLGHAARWLLYVRSHWLRMPPLLLASHLTRKALRRWHDEDV